MLREDGGKLQKEMDDARVRYRQRVLKIAVWPGVCLFVGGIIIIRLLPGPGEMGASDQVAADQAGLAILGGLLLMAAGGLVYAAAPRPTAILSRAHLEGAKVEKLEGVQKLEGVPVGYARMPGNVEALHTLIEGATGTGKTQVLKRMVDYLRQRGDTVVVVDTGYDLHKALGKDDDIVLSVFDEAGPGWLPQNEIQSPADWGALADSFIGDGAGEAQQWHQMAKALFVAVARGYQREVKQAGQPFDHAELFHLLTQAPAADLAPFLSGTAAAGLAENEKGLGNVRMTFFATLKFWEHLRPGDFSVRRWVEQRGNRPSIFIPYTKRSLPECKSLISAWLDQIITAACDGGEDRENKVWIIIDELSGLGEIPALKVAVTELRKTGFRVVVGIQNYEQVEALYGRSGAVTITNNLSNKVIMRANDSATGERQSRLIGDARFRVYSASKSTGGNGGSINQSAKDEVQRIVLASEITSLPDLTALVHWAGADTWFHTPLPIYQPGEFDVQKPVTVSEVARVPAAPSAPPTPEQEALQARLRASGLITPEGMDQTEGPRPAWSQVDELLRKIGGPEWEGERFRAKVLASLGWHPETGWDEGRSKVSRAYENARQLLTKTIDRAQIERDTSNTEKKDK